MNTVKAKDRLTSVVESLQRTLAKEQARVDKLEQALQRIRDCDFVITLPDRMDAVRAIAREALG
jgi:cell division protein FtsB